MRNVCVFRDPSLSHAVQDDDFMSREFLRRSAAPPLFYTGIQKRQRCCRSPKGLWCQDALEPGERALVVWVDAGFHELLVLQHGAAADGALFGGREFSVDDFGACVAGVAAEEDFDSYAREFALCAGSAFGNFVEDRVVDANVAGRAGGEGGGDARYARFHRRGGARGLGGGFPDWRAGWGRR